MPRCAAALVAASRSASAPPTAPRAPCSPQRRHADPARPRAAPAARPLPPRLRLHQDRRARMSCRGCGDPQAYASRHLLPYFRQITKETTMSDFIEGIAAWFLMHPPRTKALGHLLFYVGAGIVIAGLCGNFARASVTAVKSLALPHNSPLPSLADIYPQLPTFWIPENLFTGFLAVAIAMIGAWLIRFGKRVERFY